MGRERQGIERRSSTISKTVIGNLLALYAGTPINRLDPLMKELLGVEQPQLEGNGINLISFLSNGACGSFEDFRRNANRFALLRTITRKLELGLPPNKSMSDFLELPGNSLGWVSLEAMAAIGGKLAATEQTNPLLPVVRGESPVGFFSAFQEHFPSVYNSNRLDDLTTRQHTDPKTQSIGEGVSNAKDALSIDTIGQFGWGIKQILAWLSAGDATIKVITKTIAAGESPLVMEVKKGYDGLFYGRFHKPTEEESRKILGKSGTTVEVLGIDMSPDQKARVKQNIIERFGLSSGVAIELNGQRINQNEGKKVYTGNQKIIESNLGKDITVTVDDTAIIIADTGRGMEEMQLFHMFSTHNTKEMQILSPGVAREYALHNGVFSLVPSTNARRITFSRNGETIPSPIDLTLDFVSNTQSSIDIDLGLALTVSQARVGFEVNPVFAEAVKGIVDLVLASKATDHEKVDVLNALVFAVKKLGQHADGTIRLDETGHIARKLLSDIVEKLKDPYTQFINTLQNKKYTLLPAESAYAKVENETASVLYLDPLIILSGKDMQALLEEQGFTRLYENSGIKTTEGWRVYTGKLKRNNLLHEILQLPSPQERVQALLHNGDTIFPAILDSKNKIAVIDADFWKLVAQTDQHTRKLIFSLLELRLNPIDTHYSAQRAKPLIQFDISLQKGIAVSHEEDALASGLPPELAIIIADRDTHNRIISPDGSVMSLSIDDGIITTTFPDGTTNTKEVSQLLGIERIHRQVHQLPQGIVVHGIETSLTENNVVAYIIWNDGAVTRHVIEGSHPLRVEFYSGGGQEILYKTPETTLSPDAIIYSLTKKSQKPEIVLENAQLPSGKIHSIGRLADGSIAVLASEMSYSNENNKKYPRAYLDGVSPDDSFPGIARGKHIHIYEESYKNTEVGNERLILYTLRPDGTKVSSTVNRKANTAGRQYWILSLDGSTVIVEQNTGADISIYYLNGNPPFETNSSVPAFTKKIDAGEYQNFRPVVLQFDSLVAIQRDNHLFTSQPNANEQLQELEIPVGRLITEKGKKTVEYVLAIRDLLGTSTRMNTLLYYDLIEEEISVEEADRRIQILRSETFQNLIKHTLTAYITKLSKTDYPANYDNVASIFLHIFSVVIKAKEPEKLTPEVIEFLLIHDKNEKSADFISIDEAQEIVNALVTVDDFQERLLIMQRAVSMIVNFKTKEERRDGVWLRLAEVLQSEHKNQFLEVLQREEAQFNKGLASLESLPITSLARLYVLYLTTGLPMLRTITAESTVEAETKIFSQSVPLELIIHLVKQGGKISLEEIEEEIQRAGGVDAIMNSLDLTSARHELMVAIWGGSVDSGTIVGRELLQNARDAMAALVPPGGTITIDSYRRSDGSLALQFSDTGKGIGDLTAYLVPGISTKPGTDQKGFFGLGLFPTFRHIDTQETETVARTVDGILKGYHLKLTTTKDSSGRVNGITVDASVLRNPPDVSTGTTIRMIRRANAFAELDAALFTHSVLAGGAGLMGNPQIAGIPITVQITNAKGELEMLHIPSKVIGERRLETLPTGKASIIVCEGLSSTMTDSGLPMSSLAANSYLDLVPEPIRDVLIRKNVSIALSHVPLTVDRAFVVGEETKTELQRIFATESIIQAAKLIAIESIFPWVPTDIFSNIAYWQPARNKPALLYNAKAQELARKINRGEVLNGEEIDFIGNNPISLLQVLVGIEWQEEGKKETQSITRKAIEIQQAAQNSVQDIKRQFGIQSLESTVVSAADHNVQTAQNLATLQRQVLRNELVTKPFEEVPGLSDLEKEVLRQMQELLGIDSIIFATGMPVLGYYSAQTNSVCIDESILNGNHVEALIHELAHVGESVLQGVSGSFDSQGFTHQAEVGLFPDFYRIMNAVFLEAVLTI